MYALRGNALIDQNLSICHLITAPANYLHHGCSDFVHNQGGFLKDSP